MKIGIKGLDEVRERLAAVRPEEIMAQALAEQADQLAQTIRDSLDQQPGGAHDRPWTRTGALRDSIAAQTDGLTAAVGSSDPAAAPQEMGTATIPPRPFLSPVAAQQGEAISKAIGDAVTAALRGDATQRASTTE